ncbi:hypothetical protein AKJ16_DCAP10606 [Drosera capensis]
MRSDRVEKAAVLTVASVKPMAETVDCRQVVFVSKLLPRQNPSISSSLPLRRSVAALDRAADLVLVSRPIFTGIRCIFSP